MKRIAICISIPVLLLLLAGWVTIQIQISHLEHSIEQKELFDEKSIRRGAFCYAEPCQFDGRRV